MFFYVMIGFFAGTGVLCLLWLGAGAFLPWCEKEQIAIFCPVGRERSLLRRYRWLRELGFVRCRLVLLNSKLSVQQQEELMLHFPGVSFASLETWKEEIERE